MDIFAPSEFVGIGMGSIAYVVALLGLIGFCAAVGMLVAEGPLGAVALAITMLVLFGTNDVIDNEGMLVLGSMLIIIAAAGARFVFEQRALRDRASLTGRAKDDDTTSVMKRSIRQRERFARFSAFLGVAFAGAFAGVTWAQWDESSLLANDNEALIALAVGVVAAAIGGDAVWKFMTGAIRAGGSKVIVGAVIALVSVGLLSASIFVPFAGAVVLAFVAYAAYRLRKRHKATYEGLRILR